MKEEKFLGWNLFPKLVTGTKKNEMSAAARLVFFFENAAGIWNFSCFIAFYCTLQLINKIQRMLVFIFYCAYSYYAYCKKLLKCCAVVRWSKIFLLRAAGGSRSCKKLQVTLDMWYTYEQIVVKQILKRSLYSSGNFPGVWSLKADVSGLNVGPIVLGDQEWKTGWT